MLVGILTDHATDNSRAYNENMSSTLQRSDLNVTSEVIRLIDEILGLDGRGLAFTRDTPLLGAVPELDSMAVVSLITGLESHFGVTVDDDDLSGATFATVGTLADLITDKLSA